MKNTLKIIFGLALLMTGFLAGTAWKTTDTTQADLPSEQLTQTDKKTPTEEEPTSLPEVLNSAEKATISLFKQAAPSVAFITTSTRRWNFFTRDVTEIPKGSGSGFVWDKEGHIVTNYHVIQGADKAQVTLADGETYEANLVGIAPGKDLAVLKIEAEADIRPLPLGQSKNLQVGQSVYAIGNPFGLDQTLTTGIISALGREIESVAGIPIREVIQTDAAINPGNSGGPLLNSSGKLIGVNTAIYSPSGASAGIGFSIPVDVVKWVLPELIEHGRLMRPTLSIEYASEQINRRLGIEGVLIIQVLTGGAADKAGLQPTYRDRRGAISLGDIIVAVNGIAVKNSNDMILELEKFKPTDKVILRVLRNEREMEVEVELDAAR